MLIERFQKKGAKKNTQGSRSRLYNPNQVSGLQMRLSFIGFSMGGLVVRAALPFLLQYHPFLYNYVSLSSPHLGCLLDSSYLIA